LLADPLAGQQVSVLDVGAGDGLVAARLLDVLPAGSAVTCVDAAYTDEHLASLRATAPRGLAFERACPDRSFDAMILLDVLEHVADDHALVRDVVARLRPGGLLLAAVPAHQALFTQHDVALGHHRRYSAGELRDLVVSAGLMLRVTGSLFTSLLVPRAIGKALERARGVGSRPSSGALAAQIATGISAWRHGRIVTNLVRGALEVDARLSALAARWSAPTTGLSLWALCERTR
jgi:SAM-dependent methyltransferase